MTNIEVGSKWVGPAGGIWRVANILGDDVYLKSDITFCYVTVNKEWFLKTATPYEKKEPREFWLYRDSRQQPFCGILDSRPVIGFFADVVHVREVVND